MSKKLLLLSFIATLTHLINAQTCPAGKKLVCVNITTVLPVHGGGGTGGGTRKDVLLALALSEMTPEERENFNEVFSNYNVENYLNNNQVQLSLLKSNLDFNPSIQKSKYDYAIEFSNTVVSIPSESSSKKEKLFIKKVTELKEKAQELKMQER